MQVKISGEGFDNIERPTYTSIYMNLAHDLARRSTCKRLHVGTVITSTDGRKVYAVGYNGNATKLPNACDSEEPGSCGCLHSEENAIISCDVPRELPKIVYVTHLPCVMCAKRMLNLGGVKTLHYCSPYRIPTGVEILRGRGVEVVRYEAEHKL